MLLFLLNIGGPGGTREKLFSLSFLAGYPWNVFALFRKASDTRPVPPKEI